MLLHTAASSGESAAQSAPRSAPPEGSLRAMLADLAQLAEPGVLLRFVGAISTLALLCAASMLLVLAVFRALRSGRLADAPRRTRHVIDDALRRPTLLLAPSLVAAIATYGVSVLPRSVWNGLAHLFTIATIAGIAWVLVGLVAVGKALVVRRFALADPDNLRARQVHTQFDMVGRIASIGCVVLGIAAVLTTFDGVRHVGVSVLASAGIVGIALGVAARPTLETVFAGLQLAFAQPIRIDDVVIVEGEWGRIEEIHLTYAVVRIWDDRRLVVPIRRFIDQPFQNWTRTRADLIGSVFLRVGFDVSIAALRRETERIVRDDGRWDRRTCVLQVTEWHERHVEVRVLVSARNASDAWDLRCAVREGLLGFIQREHGDALARTRVQLHRGRPAAPGAP